MSEQEKSIMAQIGSQLKAKTKSFVASTGENIQAANNVIPNSTLQKDKETEEIKKEIKDKKEDVKNGLAADSEEVDNDTKNAVKKVNKFLKKQK